MAIDRNEALNEYRSKASAAGEKLVRKYIARNDKLVRATSDSAQKNYVAAMTDPKVLQRRVAKLKKLTEADLNAAMQAKGASAYATGVNAGADKWGKGVEPYFSEIERVIANLPARGRTARENVMNRTLPLAEALQKKKEALTV